MKTKKPPKPKRPAETMTYAYALKLERDRERLTRKTEQGAFESSFAHIENDFNEDEDDGEIIKTWESDHGAGVERMIRELDDEPGRKYATTKADYQKKKDTAVKRLRRNHPELVPVLLLVIKNGKNRKESIKCLMSNIGRKKKTLNTPSQK